MTEAKDLNTGTAKRLRKDISGLDYEVQPSSVTPRRINSKMQVALMEVRTQIRRLL